MTVAEKLTTIAENEQKVFDAGYAKGQAAGGGSDDKFWDLYQNYGNRTEYRYAFFGNCWTDELYNPKYPIVASDVSTDIFGLTHVTDTLVAIDFSKNKTVNTQVFRNSKLKTIRELVVHEALTYTSWFFNATELENITIYGTIGQLDFDIHWSTKLSEESGFSIIDALSTTTSGLSVTLPIAWKERYVAKRGEEAFNIMLAAHSNWTILWL